MELSERDRIWLKANHPQLKIADEVPIKIEGKLLFRMLYREGENQYIINPRIEENGNKYSISDCYEMEVVLTTSDNSNLPQVIERGGRIQKVLDKYNIKDSRDIHVYPVTNVACLCARTEENFRMPKGFNIEDFINNLVIPFFYYQSYYEKYGEEPYQGYSHGPLGILENYTDIRDGSCEKAKEFITALQKDKDWVIFKGSLGSKKKLKGFHTCLCGKNIFRKCHKKVFEGLWKLRDDINTHKIDF